jgi:hypothetical protein
VDGFTALKDAGVVIIFAAFVIYMTREMTKFVNRRDEQWKELLTDLIDRVEKLSDRLARNTAVLVLLYRDKGPDSASKQLIEEFLDECNGGEGGYKKSSRS